MAKVRRLGLLTAGGDCPGLNAVIRAVTKSAARQDPPIQVVGILDGYAGLVLGRTRLLSDDDVIGFAHISRDLWLCKSCMNGILPARMIIK